MAIYNDSVQTDAGRALENRARSGEGAIEFTYIKTGSGAYTEDERGGIRGASDLKSPKQSFSFSGIKLGDGGDYLSLESVIKNEGVEEGYHLSEVGIFARLAGAEESVMYCISLVDEPDYIPAQTGEKIYEIALQSLIKCYDAAHVTILYENTTYATAKALMDHIFNQDNPHNVTKEQIGLGNVDNTADMDKPVSTAQQAAIDAAKEQAGESLDGHVNDADNPHKVTKEQIGLGSANNTPDVSKPVSAPQQAALDALYEQMAAYTRQQIANLIDGAPESLDTLKEVSDAIAAHKTVMDALDAAIGKKANAAEFDSHTKDATKHVMANERTAWNGKLAPTGDASNVTATFSQATARANLTSKEKLSVSLGKIMKWLADLANGAASTLLGANLTANRALVADGNGKVAASSVTATELGYLAGVKSKVQDQLDELNTGINNVNLKFEPKFTPINTTNVPSGYWGITPGGRKRFVISGFLGIALTANQERTIYTNDKIGATYTALSKVIPISQNASPIFALLRISVGGEVSITPYSNVPTTQRIRIDETYL